MSTHPARSVALVALGVLGAALGLAGSALSPQAAVRIAATPVLHESAAALATSGCPKVAGKKVAERWKTCEPDSKGKVHACAKYDPPLSDRCAAESDRSAGVKVDYTYFGQTDCNSWKRKRKIERIALHNGGKASVHAEAWKCRRSGAHYTVQRDGRIFQHIGEERASAHANTENEDSIGIELETQVKYGGRCNDPKSYRKIADARGIAIEDVVAELCGPTAAQYEALRDLIADIETRHPIREDGIFSHCEVKATDHGDPRALDWRELGMAMRPAVHHCDWHGIAALKVTPTAYVPRDAGSVVILAKGSKSGVEVGDHAYLATKGEKVGAWFQIEKVTEHSAQGFVALPPEKAVKFPQATIVSTPGKKPTRGLSAAAKGESSTVAKSGAKPALGSCASGYTYHKGGTIESWTTRPDGTIATVEIVGAGWSHRVCDDSTGMVYAGDVGGDFLADTFGKKVKLTVTKVEETKVTASLTEGWLQPSRLGKSRKVVLRAKK